MQRARFSVACELQGVSGETTGFGVLMVWSQIVIWMLTVSRKANAMGIGSPFVTVAVRDGAWAILLLLLIFLFIIPFSMVTQVARSEFVFGWPITLLSLMVSCNLCCQEIEQGSIVSIDLRSKIERHAD
ncbi:hypothetical protein AN958_10032 [Leucoagaricus sp. SymC.cos]|nr:hypothetical protein AN958_10032 [Leucoagaricus sp. SymC.cos]